MAGLVYVVVVVAAVVVLAASFPGIVFAGSDCHFGSLEATRVHRKAGP